MPQLYQVIDSSGIPVNAHFSVTPIEEHVAIHFESRGGTRKAQNARNTEYQRGLSLLLEGLGRLELRIDDILVDTQVTQRKNLSENERRINSDAITYPINLSTYSDFNQLRLDICRPQSAIGSTQGSTPSSGNKNKRLAIKIGYKSSQITNVEDLASLVLTLGIPAASHRERISLPETIDREVLLRAIDRIKTSGITPHHLSHTYDLIHEDKKYPPVAVVAFAYEEISGNPVAPGAIRGGKNTQAFKILKKENFNVRPKYLEPTEDDNVLDERADEIQRQGELGPEPPAGNENPEQRPAPASVSYVRDPAVKAWVLEKAEGICELCQQPAPFIRNNGHPYLEVHHVRPLAEDGADTTTNAVAICPNCHRRCHHSSDPIKATEQLYEQVERLEKP